MKTIIPILFLAMAAFAAPINVRFTIPGVVTNAPGTIDGLGTKVSEYPYASLLHSNYLILLASPSDHTNYSVSYGDLATNITATVSNFTSITVSGLTNTALQPNQFVATGVNTQLVSTLNAWPLTNLPMASIVSPTNGVSSATAIDFSVPEATTNITANLAFTSIINWNPTNYNYAIRHIINRSGGNLTLTTGNGWGTDPILRTSTTSYTITNNTVVDLLVGAQILFWTNANVLIASQ